MAWGPVRVASAPGSSFPARPHAPPPPAALGPTRRPPPPPSRRFCRDADAAVADFKAANARLDALCRSISELVLVDVEKKKIYQHAEFAARQVRGAPGGGGGERGRGREDVRCSSAWMLSAATRGVGGGFPTRPPTTDTHMPLT